MFVALAWIAGTPTAVITGKLISVPPPASALTIPAATAAPAQARWASPETSLRRGSPQQRPPRHDDAAAGRVGGGWRRGGSSASSNVVAWVTENTARSNAACVAAEVDVTPLTLRTYWRAAASISTGVAPGSRPRNVVMLRHMPPPYERRHPWPTVRP